MSAVEYGFTFQWKWRALFLIQKLNGGVLSRRLHFVYVCSSNGYYYDLGAVESLHVSAEHGFGLELRFVTANRCGSN